MKTKEKLELKGGRFYWIWIQAFLDPELDVEYDEISFKYNIVWVKKKDSTEVRSLTTFTGVHDPYLSSLFFPAPNKKIGIEKRERMGHGH